MRQEEINDTTDYDSDHVDDPINDTTAITITNPLRRHFRLSLSLLGLRKSASHLADCVVHRHGMPASAVRPQRTNYRYSRKSHTAVLWVLHAQTIGPYDVSET